MDGINLEKYSIEEMFEVKCIYDSLEKGDYEIIMDLCNYDKETALNTIEFFNNNHDLAVEQVYSDYMQHQARKTR